MVVSPHHGKGESYEPGTVRAILGSIENAAQGLLVEDNCGGLAGDPGGFGDVRVGHSAAVWRTTERGSAHVGQSTVLSLVRKLYRI